MWFRDAYVGGKTIKNYFNKKQDTGYLWQVERETCHQDLLSWSQFPSPCPGWWIHEDSFWMIFNCTQVLTYSCTVLRVLFHNSDNKQNRTQVSVSGGLDSRSGLSRQSRVTQMNLCLNVFISKMGMIIVTATYSGFSTLGTMLSAFIYQ